MYQFTGTVPTKYHRQYDLNIRKPRSRCWQVSSFWGLPPWLVRWPLSPVSSHGLPSVPVCVPISFAYKEISHIGHIPETSFYINYLFKYLIFKCSHILKYKGLGLIWICGRWVYVLVTQSCPTLCDPMDYSLPGSSVHGIFKARILEWVAISFSRGSSQSRDRTHVSCIACR